MNIDKLTENHIDLIKTMQQNGYSKVYISKIQSEIYWVIDNYHEHEFQTYVDAYRIRVSCMPDGRKKWYRLVYGILMRFDIYNEYPDRTRRNPLIKRESYYQLNTTFRDIMDLYIKTATDQEKVSESTIKRNTSIASCFLLAMQNKGLLTLSDITEDQVLSYFLNEEGINILSKSCKNAIASVFKSDLGIFNKPAKMILAYLPKLKSKRKNIQYLTPEEVNDIHETLNNGDNLSLRDTAIGLLLFFTGIRGCDIAFLEFNSIDWNKEEIRLVQQKTSNNLVLPLTITIGNAIYDYITKERPKIVDTHIFLNEIKPYSPVKAHTIRNVSKKLYKAAGVRQSKGDRRGTNLFRHNLATTLVGNGITRPVISDILGHSDPNSLDRYLFADVIHLRECALSIENFPINEEVFKI